FFEGDGWHDGTPCGYTFILSQTGEAPAFPFFTFRTPFLHYSPCTVTITSRSRGRTSHARWMICCQVPRRSRPLPTGTVSVGPSSVACRCEGPLPSCQACSWP